MKLTALYPRIFFIITIASVLVTSCQSPNQVTAPNLARTAAAETVTAMAVNPPTAKIAPQTTPTQTVMPTTTPVAASPTPQDTATPTIGPTPVQLAYGPTNFPTNVDPLTGVIVSIPTLLDRRPLMIKVANYPAIGRPHAGLSLADIVFEYWTGEGANRFMALYYGKDSKQVGPMRSGRLIDVQLVPMYQGILGFVSAYQTIFAKIMNALGSRAITRAPSTCPGICDDGSNTVISVFADTKALSELATKNGVVNKRQNLDGMRFDPAVPAGGKTGDDLLVQYSFYNRGEWRYDKASGTYLRWIENVDAKNNLTMIPLVDRLDNKQLAFNNVVVLFAYYIQYAPSEHDVTVKDNTTGRRAILYRDGRAYEGVWKSAGGDKPIQFFDAKGQPMAFKPGNSWFVFTGIYSTFDQTDPGKWEMKFNLP
ncbi:MAG TPA: DUF3048 domain-containing protein [Anaerolineaceae bacterium]